jgi:hypothetical protein
MTRFFHACVTHASRLRSYARRGEEAGYAYKGVSNRR